MRAQVTGCFTLGKRIRLLPLLFFSSLDLLCSDACRLASGFDT